MLVGHHRPQKCQLEKKKFKNKERERSNKESDELTQGAKQRRGMIQTCEEEEAQRKMFREAEMER